MEEAVAAWKERRRRGGGGGGVEEKAVAWRLGDFNMRKRHLCFVCGGSGDVVVEGAEAWRRRQYVGG